MLPDEVKTCYVCEKTKTYTEFSRNRDKITNLCKACAVKRATESNKRKNPEDRRRITRESFHRIKARDPWYQRRYQLRVNYNLSVDEYKKLFDAQKGVCAICGTVVSDTGLRVDHDHETGRIRGLLCGACNLGLGSFKDDPIRLSNAISYLTGCTHVT